MSTARNYIAKELYRATFVVMLALIGLFSFFTLVDQLDRVSERLSLKSLLYIELLALPTRTYELLPIGVLIGAVLALAGLAQRNELVILRVSGVSATRLLGMLWMACVPIIALAIILSEYMTPAAEIRYSEANLVLRGKVEGGRLISGYWFREPTAQGGSRVLNIGELLSSGEVANLTIYEMGADDRLTLLSQAQRGVFEGDKLRLFNVSDNIIDDNALQALADGLPASEPLMIVQTEPTRLLTTSLTPARLVARIATPEKMSLLTLWDYIDFLQSNNQDATRQIVAVWRKIAYPFTLLVMLTIAAPIAYMQTRRGGIGAKVFAGILTGTVFFMLGQLTLNMGMLYQWPPVVTALAPNVIAFVLAFGTLLAMERRFKWPRKTVRAPTNSAGGMA
ncbi:LPS export ABC transporter permease LptG [Orrella daihaiensis]|uniref:LPS export ABC transporter permease LptG n=1 Tax=Orrella daihaiensis TaxID=2782176 RepID=A0ABY4AIS4_9BURK|nr:LPS export ABC transporter permease LptG [Orrella daihaiensis]UOD50188.1 LPS export ABC transporter permease LptG [Orrella daihaiensis]